MKYDQNGPLVGIGVGGVTEAVLVEEVLSGYLQGMMALRYRE